MPGRTSDRLIIQRLLQHSRRAWPQLALILFLNLLAAPLALLLPLPVKIAVDSVIGNVPLPGWLAALAPAASGARKLEAAVALLLIIALLTYLQNLAVWLLQTWTGERIVNDFRARLFWHAQRLTLMFHQRTGQNDIAYRIQNDAPAIQSVLLQGIVPFLTAAVTLAAMLFVMGRISWQFGLLALSVAPALFFFSFRSSKRSRPRWTQVKELDTLAMSTMHEALSGVQVVKAYSQEEREERRFVERSEARMHEQVRLARVQAGYHVAMGLTIAVGTAAALYLGVHLVLAGTLTLGTLLLAMSYLVQIHQPLQTMSAKLPELQGYLASGERALRLLDEKLEAPSPKTVDESHRTWRVQGKVEFRSVQFGYTPERVTLDDLSFVVEPGTNVGIIGPTGAGKSTLVSLLTRFHEPASGQILLDDVDLRDYTLNGLRHQFALVQQEPLLFSTTIAENIGYAIPSATPQQIERAARMANAHHFIQKLPQGYQTRLGPRGVRLSGGERQRISLARAFLKDAPVLILDEPTSAVDVRTEAAIMHATEELMKGRTCFIIAHRLNTLEKCDVILSLRDGKLVSVTANVSDILRAAAQAQADSVAHDKEIAELLR